MRRPPTHIRRDLRNWLDMLVLYQEMGYAPGIAHAKREVRAMVAELLFNRYGRTDVA